MLFTSAKVTHMNSLPQGKREKIVVPSPWFQPWMEKALGCTNTGECEAVCPKSISLDMIAQLNRDYQLHRLKTFRAGLLVVATGTLSRNHSDLGLLPVSLAWQLVLSLCRSTGFLRLHLADCQDVQNASFHYNKVLFLS